MPQERVGRGQTASKPTTTARSTAPLRQRFPDYGDVEASDSEGEHNTDDEGETTAVDTSTATDNYVRKVLAKERPLPPITIATLPENLQIISCIALTLVPTVAIYGAFTTPLMWQTALWCFIFYFYTGLGITAGYHRLWAHRSYTATKPLQYFLALGGLGAVQGSIKWWSRGHRAHHRYTDTELDPYSAQRGFFWSHIGWMLVKPRRTPGTADVSDLSKSEVVKWQHRWYLPGILGMGFIFPMCVAGLGWGDWRGGFFFAGAARLTFVHHSTFCVNSLAHWLGESSFDDKHTPKDHFLTALVTVGEGYHNFHHEFPQDFRNAIKWYQYDPTKWFIFTCYLLGLASQLKTFPDNEIKQGQFAMKLKALSNISGDIKWPTSSNHLPVLTWEEFQEASKTRDLVVISGFIHDVSTFIDEHPGGRALIKTRLGKDATTAFYGGYYDHSNAATNLLAQLRVGVIEGGYEVESMKLYSEIIESLKISGAAGVSGKAADLSTEVKPTVVIKGSSALKGLQVKTLDDAPRCDEIRMTGGISQAFLG
ncbi:putative stearoyl-CoA 9-desaturase [Leucosporidium creatinivorum]|uniref:Acyl-CoA desaturase n=1 Tax=Leucosporidium creatinivorum TaxID=106004 RepID=A0A1Y2F048_9BASI|nr:putative stearoyl-CoA 9-desaturase [Leucosporidium creatinivorum]